MATSSLVNQITLEARLLIGEGRKVMVTLNADIDTHVVKIDGVIVSFRTLELVLMHLKSNRAPEETVPSSFAWHLRKQEEYRRNHPRA